MPQFISVDHSVCTGCRTCEVVCSLFHFGECNPARSAIRVIRREKDGLVFSLPLVCQQCRQATCIGACPSDALSRKSENDPIMVDKERCSGCGDCAEACPAGCIFLDAGTKLALSCDLCGGQPQCIPMCHSKCLTLGAGQEEDDQNRIKRLAGVVQAEDLWESVPGKGER